jgi:zinc transporter ZupT
MVLLIDTAFPLDGGSSPALWAAAILLGAQSAILLTPFSSAVTMLSRLSGLHPLEIGPKQNWRFSLAVFLGAMLYLALLTLLLL